MRCAGRRVRTRAPVGVNEEVPVEALAIVVVGVLAVVGVRAVAGRVGMAAPLLLVLVGVAVSLVPAMPEVTVDAEWILAGVLPPLLYSAAVGTPTMNLRRDLRTISGLSVLLVVATTAVVGLAATWLVPGIGLAAGLALGAIISPTDAVATAIVRGSRVSPRLTAILEGESLLNDASALVVLRAAIAAMAVTVTLADVVGDFVRAVLVAVAVGWLVGRANLVVRRHLRPAAAGVAVSLVVPWAAYLASERFGGSGLVAAVVAGLVTGLGSPRYLRAQDRVTERAVWSTLELVLEGGVFLVMGLELAGLVADVRAARGSVTGAIVVALAAGAIVLAVRALFVWPVVVAQRRRARRVPQVRERLDAISDSLEERVAHGEVVRAGGPGAGRPVPAARQGRDPRRSGDPQRFAERVRARTEQMRSTIRRRQNDLDYLTAEPMGWRHGAVLVWAGMRGAVTLAAAQSLPAGTPQRSFLVLVAFVVAAGTLLVQGGTLGWVVRRLGLQRAPDDPAERADAEAVHAELVLAVRDRLSDPGLVRPDGTPYSAAVLSRAFSRGPVARPGEARSEEEVVPGEESVPDVPASDELGSDDRRSQVRAEYADLRADLLDTQRSALLAMRSEGRHTSSALDAALRVLDAEQIGLDLRRPPR
jgi:CPA1 family monovalent cation:H+ antiporter